MNNVSALLGTLMILAILFIATVMYQEQQAVEAQASHLDGTRLLYDYTSDEVRTYKQRDNGYYYEHRP